MSRARRRSAVDNVDSNDPDLKRSYNGFEINFNARLPQRRAAFGGTSTERTITNSCSAAGHDPNLLALLRSDPVRHSVQTSFKLARHLSAAVVRHHGERRAAGAGRLVCSAPPRCPTACSRPAPASTSPNGRSTFCWSRRRTNWTAATCKDRAKCTIGQRIIPGLTQASLNVPLVAGADRMHPALNQVDFSFAQERSTFGRFAINPKLDSSTRSTRTTTRRSASMQFGAATYQRPSAILQGRIIRFGVDVKW